MADGGDPGRDGGRLRHDRALSAAGFLVSPRRHGRGQDGETGRGRFLVRFPEALHLLVGLARRVFPRPLLFRNRPVPGPALPRRRLAHRGALWPHLQRRPQTADAVFHPLHRRDGFHLFPVRKTADVFQSARLPARRAGRAGGQTGRAADPLRPGLRAEADGGAWPNDGFGFEVRAGDRLRDQRRPRDRSGRSSRSAAK